MTMPVFNVVIPIYNAEKFVSKTIDSVLNQSFPNINIILVDDGSTDSSGEICDKYARLNKNIQVLHTTNQGLASARNNGMAVVKEGFISFIDADDIFSDNKMFEKIGKVIEKYNPDYIDFGFNYVSGCGDVSKNLSEVKKNTLLDRAFIRDNVIPRLVNLNDNNEYFIYDYAWNKIYKKEIIDKYNVAFIKNRRVWEDRPFVVDYISYCNTLYSMDECFYNYMDVENSLSRRYVNEFFDVILYNYKSYKSKFESEYNFETQYVYRYWTNALLNIVMWGLQQTQVSQQEVVDKIHEIFSTKEVICLFEKLVPQSKEDKVVADFVINQNIDQLIGYYKKKSKKKKSKTILNRVVAKIKRLCKG